LTPASRPSPSRTVAPEIVTIMHAAHEAGAALDPGPTPVVAISVAVRSASVLGSTGVKDYASVEGPYSTLSNPFSFQPGRPA